MFEMESNTVIREFRPDVRIESDSFKVDSLAERPIDQRVVTSPEALCTSHGCARFSAPSFLKMRLT